MKQKLGLVLSLALCSYYSYSSAEPYTYGISDNAARNALKWSMGSVLPQIPGLDISGLVYKYTTIKNPEDDMKVHVGNHNENGDGYTFRETDDWSGVPGNTILKSFSLPHIPIEKWGDGFISIEGKGSVTDATVIYSFRIDECFDPQLNPSCPDYVKPRPNIPEVDIYNALDDESVLDSLAADDFEYDEESEANDEDDEEDEPTRIELGLMASSNALTLFKKYNQSKLINMINMQTNMQTYYNSNINGGIYSDKYKLSENQMPDNTRALRNNLAQQLKHEQMIDMQYNK